jgi:D-alanine-D-alanine ligase-like ATP-grasp enzyme
MGSIRRRGAAMVTAAAAVVLCPGLLAGGGAAAAAGLAGVAGARPAASGGTWGKAEEVPGTAALNAGGTAEVYSVSCASAGNCSAGGYYTDRSDHDQVFVVSEVKGRWGKAEEVPGTAGLNKGGDAGITSVSCASAGNCKAGGSYKDASDHDQAFVVNEVKGRWGKAEEVPGTAALNAGGYAGITSVSCARAGSCGAGGYYADRSGHVQAFVVSEVKGRWGKAEEVPGTAGLNKGTEAEIKSVSCARAGSCGAGGYYTDGSDHDQVFVVSEVKGRWGKAEEVPGTAGLSQGGESWIYSLSCASAGNCGAGGYYLTPTVSDSQHAFVVSEVKGRWGKAQEVPGTAGLNTGGSAWISSVSCASAGNCSAGGYYDDSDQAFVVGEVKGKWGKAEEVPGTAGLNADGSAGISSVSCASAGNCSAAGSYRDASGHFQVFVVSEVKGRWGKAEEVPGTAALNKGGQAGITSVSCAPAGSCSAGGYYDDKTGGQQAFVVSQVR